MNDKTPIHPEGTVAKSATVIKIRVEMGGYCQGILDSSTAMLIKQTPMKDQHQ
jgi:hypothetical protein